MWHLCGSLQKVLLGSLTKEEPEGKLAVAWKKFIGADSAITVVNATRGFETLVSAKDADGVVRAQACLDNLFCCCLMSLHVVICHS